ncbi:hypothetical protein M8J76_013644 [Diaphorina citri]|nr:hypothetical protein M8J76_013644 [Diaphorina citri]
MSAENPDIASSGENIENEADTTGHIEDTGYVIPPDGVPSDLPEDARSGGEELGEHEGKGEEPIGDQEKPDEKQDKPGERIENVEGKDKEKGDTTTSDEKRLLSGEIEQLLQDHLMDRLIDGMDIVSLLSGAGEGSDLNLDARIPADVFLSDKCTLDSHYVEIEYSFGYDCGKNFNICCPDPNYLVFLSGCFIHILNISDKLVELRRGSGGQGLGCITKNNTEPHIAIGEKGHNPDIIIYEWPSFNVVSVLRGGSVKQYTCVDYSPKGDILVSQSGEPDHTIGIWDWKQRHVILKVKSHAQDVYNARFSKYVTGHLSSSGLGHIKMWKMVNTFTSLKLLGVIGRFGKTTTCDILAIYPMPDEKVLSGCEWGNILVWDDGMIKIEVSRKNRRPCHADQIVQFLYDPQTLQITTVGADGFIRMWNYQTIDLANPPEEEKFVELEPIFEIEVKEMIFGAQLMHIVESPGTEDCTWFGQDKWGGFWKLHVEVTTNLRPAEKIYVTHTGPIVDMAPSPRGLYLVTVGRYGRLAVWSVLDKKLVLFHDAKPFRITRILWLSTEALKSGCAMVAGLANGLIKLLIIRLKEKLC